MQSQSLERVLDIIVEAIANSDIEETDKVELLINLKHFLDPEKYSDNRDTLMQHNAERSLTLGGRTR